MRENKLRRVWKAGGAAVNGWLAIPNSFSAETMAQQGWDSLTVDLQHGVVDYQAMVTMLQAISTTDTVPVVRVPWLEPGEHVFRASRFGRGNHLFPAQVVITPSSLTLYKPQWIGKLEESIHMAHVASIKIDTHLIFSDISIETSGGQDPVICQGHTKGDAVSMKELLERFQSEYYGKASGPRS